MFVLKFFLLFLMGCSIESTSRTGAVADSDVILGTVFDGRNYSLILCKALPSYTEAQLADRNICRPALVDASGKAVVFSYEQLKMTLGEQLTGLGKGALAIASVPLMIIAGRRIWPVLVRKPSSAQLRSARLKSTTEELEKADGVLQEIRALNTDIEQTGSKAKALIADEKLEIDQLATSLKNRQNELVNESDELLGMLRRRLDERAKSLMQENNNRIERISNDSSVSLTRIDENVPEELRPLPVGSFLRDVEMNHLYDQIGKEQPELAEELLNWWYGERKLVFLGELQNGKVFDLDKMSKRLKKPVTRVYDGSSLDIYYNEYPDQLKIVQEFRAELSDNQPIFLNNFRVNWKDDKHKWPLFRDGYRHYRELMLENERIKLIELHRKGDADIQDQIADIQQRLVASKRRLLSNRKQQWNWGDDSNDLFESSRDSLNAISNSNLEINLLSENLNYLKNIEANKFASYSFDDEQFRRAIAYAEQTPELESFMIAKQRVAEARDTYNEAVKNSKEALKNSRDEKLQSVTESLHETRKSISDDLKQQSTDKDNNKKKERVLAGSAVVLTSLATIVDYTSKYIWGYDQRQLRNHWDKIFVVQKFANPHQVENVAMLLKTLAKSRNYTVNPEALALTD